MTGPWQEAAADRGDAGGAVQPRPGLRFAGADSPPQGRRRRPPLGRGRILEQAQVLPPGRGAQQQVRELIIKGKSEGCRT